MEQLQHKLTNVSPLGRRCSVDQNTLKRTDLDDFVACYFGCSDASVKRKGDGSQSRGYNGNRHDRKEAERFNPDKSGANRFERVESERFRSFAYEELIKRDPPRRVRPSGEQERFNLDIFWLKDEALEDSANLPAPEVIAQEIVEDLEAALQQFAAVAQDLKN